MRRYGRVWLIGPDWLTLTITLTLRTPILVGCSWYSRRILEVRDDD